MRPSPVVLSCLLVIGCAHPSGWLPDNRARLDRMMSDVGSRGAGYDEAHPPVAVFDWDNTMARNDVGDATLYWMLQHDKVRMPPSGDWRQTSRWLTDAGVAALDAACGKLAAPGAPIATSKNAPCATEIVTIYEDKKTTHGEPAFAGWNHRRMEPSYAFGVALEAGYTVEEVRAIAESAIAENLGNPVGTEQTVGTRKGLAHWLRVYDEMRQLVADLRAHGFDVWIVSASAQPIVQQFATRVGLDAAHVVGIRALVGADGKTGYHLAGCGDVADGADELVTYIDGKRCWINKAIFGEPTAPVTAPNPDGKKRPTFSAGDSDTDVTFLRDATALRLVIDRNRAELLCHALRNSDGKWLINPMFFDPLPRRTTPYPCTKDACLDEKSQPIPCVGDDGQPIPDEVER